jgi:hypothetical protein
MNVLNQFTTWSLGFLDSYKGISHEIKYVGLAVSTAVNSVILTAKVPKAPIVIIAPTVLLVTGVAFGLGNLIGNASRPPPFDPQYALLSTLAIEKLNQEANKRTSIQ